jgi:hypothetical protein
VTTRNVTTFNGTNPRSVNTTASDPYGDQYAVCTTTQYDLRPSTNSSTLSVLLQSTDAITAAKTMKNMQAQVEQNGTLRSYDEWSWWYPWYRTHYVYAENKRTMFDMGMSILPFGDSFYGVEEFFQRMISLFPRIVWSVTSALILGEFFCLLASSSGPWSCAAAFLVSLSMKSLSIMSSFDNIDGLISIFFGIYFPTVYTGLTRGWDMFMTVIQLCEGIKTLAEIGFGRIYRLVSFSMNFIFMSIVMQRLKYLGAW